MPPTLPSLDQAAALGRTLRAIDPSLLKKQPPGKRASWWRGDERYCDAFFEHDERGLAFFEVTLRGRSLRWDRDAGRLKTGATEELEEGGTMQPMSTLVVDDRALDARTVAVVRALLGARAGEEPFDAACAALAGAAS